MTEGTERVVATNEGEGGTVAPRPRRRHRGGRGRGRSRAATGSESESAPQTETVVEAAAAGQPDTPPVAGSEQSRPPRQPRQPRQAASVPRQRQASTRTDAAPEAEATPEATPTAARRRRRRGGRGRGGKRPALAGEEPGRAEESSSKEEAVEARKEPGQGPSRPRTRRTSSAATAAVSEEPGETGTIPEAGETAAAETTAPGGTTAARKRRRRRKPAGTGTGSAAEGAEAAPATSGEPAAVEEGAVPAPARRRSRAKAKPEPESGPELEAPAPERPSRGGRRTRAAAETKEAAPPTRLRRSRQTGGSRRRREAPLVVPRVTDKLMAITEHGERDQIAILEGRELVQHYVTRAGATSMVGNVYLGRVQNVLPGMEAAFVDVGRGRNAVLYAGEVNYSSEDLEGPAPRIEHVLKSGQPVVVQVTKDPIGGKGARLTAQISMPGRYLVLVPNSNVTGISRRLPDAERRRLKTILKKVLPEGHGLIIRTAAEGASAEELEADLARVLEEWESIEKRSKKAKAPAVLYEEPELTVRAVRDLFTDEEFRELVTDSRRVYELVTEYLGQVAPELLAKVRLHEGKLPVFEEFHIVEQIHKGLDRKVWLASGGYIVIDRTEALTVIDVNTGKSVGKTNLEETVVNTNLEAAREVARQLRLRDIGGMIIIDFIDMLLEENKKRVIDTLQEAMAQDKTRSQVFDISPLGLLEVTRKRVSGGLLESFSETCPTCEGRGVLLTYEA